MNDRQLAELVKAMNNCVTMCNYCAAACLREANARDLHDCISFNLDCAGICALNAAMLARGSKRGRHLLKVCTEVCGICATECEKHSHMEHCKDCAATCRICETACMDAAVVVM